MLQNTNQDFVQSKSSLPSVRNEARKKLRRLTKREFQVLLYSVAGVPNKIIAYRLNLSQRTVENHRLKIARKTGCKSLPELFSILILGEKSCLPYCVMTGSCMRSYVSCYMAGIFVTDDT